MFGSKNKALTFSYDDGVSQDTHLIEIFNKYGLKGTFNLNSELLGTRVEFMRDGVKIEHKKQCPEDVKYIYEGQEVAVHTLTHPNLADIKDENEIIRQVEMDREKLSEIVGYEVKGMAYPFGNRDRRVADIIKNHTGVQYARAVEVTKSFEVYDDLYLYRGTLYHHRDWNELFDMGRRFLEIQADTPQVFYIWGHAYEFDIYPERWEQFEEFCKMMSGHKDIFYGTNIEVLTAQKK